ncbi:hypothetical protein ACFQZ4_03980 [Catellatospora coxensis]
MLGLVVVAGCALNKGSALAGDFEQEWAGTPDVTTVDAKGDNTLPFLGSASGTLVVADGTPAERVTELADELRRYVAEHDGTKGRITADGVSFTVVADEAHTGEVVALWRSLTADGRVVEADIDTVPAGDVRWRIEVDAVDAPAAMAVFDDLTADGDRHRSLSAVTSLEVRTGADVRPGLHVETGADGRTPARRSPRTRRCAPVTRSSARP